MLFSHIHYNGYPNFIEYLLFSLVFLHKNAPPKVPVSEVHITSAATEYFKIVFTVFRTHWEYRKLYEYFP